MDVQLENLSQKNDIRKPSNAGQNPVFEKAYWASRVNCSQKR
tara:strand:- start:165 stop:290 length:126 start_codon:yes stop_codon:yes gene_type:complete